ncbi:MAG: POTRA domain-containing protein [Bacteroidia bacterium]
MRIRFLCLLIALAFGKNVHAQAPVVKAIDFKGNKKTKEAVMLRSMTFAAGDTLDPARLLEIMAQNRENLFNLELFNSVNIQPEPEEDGLRIMVEVEERWYIIPVPQGRSWRSAMYKYALRQGNLKGWSMAWPWIGGTCPATTSATARARDNKLFPTTVHRISLSGHFPESQRRPEPGNCCAISTNRK